MGIGFLRTARSSKPVPDWQLNISYENETAELLEKVMNGEDDFPARHVQYFLELADKNLDTALRAVMSAIELAEIWKKEKKLSSLFEQLEELRVDLKLERKELCK